METMNLETVNGQHQRSSRAIAAPTSEPRLSLYEIETVLSDLAALRSEMQETGEDTEAVDAEIVAYISREIRKVDGIAGYLKHCALMASAAKEEAQRMAARSRSWADRGSLIKETCMRVMLMIGVKRLDGHVNTLIVKGNGGRCAVEISNPELVPSEYMRVTVDMRSDVWHEIEKSMGAQWIKENVGRTIVTPALSLIGEALEKDAVAGCRLLERGAHVECR